jgi:hypothetical protein
MKFILIMLSVVLGVILFLGIIALIIYGRLKRSLRQFGFKNINSLKDMKFEMEQIKKDDSDRVRSLSGMTSLLLPRIRADFPEFNEQELYAKIEKNLRTIFESIEKKDVSKVLDLYLLETSLKHTIEDYADSNIEVNYDDLKFHKYAISQYLKKDGIATITVCVALEYYYQKKKDGKMIEDFTNYKNQTRYRCNYIYIYDSTKVKDSTKVLAINCPNCGAVIKSLGHKYCDYCGAGVKEVNLKSWELSSYEEF